jgi:hypothetical protein
VGKTEKTKGSQKNYTFHKVVLILNDKVWSKDIAWNPLPGGQVADIVCAIVPNPFDNPLLRQGFFSHKDLWTNHKVLQRWGILPQLKQAIIFGKEFDVIWKSSECI